MKTENEIKTALLNEVIEIEKKHDDLHSVFQVEHYRRLKGSEKVIGTATGVSGMEYHLVITKTGLKKMIPKMRRKEFKKIKS